MNILHITKKYLPEIGGDCIVVYNLKKEQEKKGHKVQVLTHNIKGIKDNNIFTFGFQITGEELDKISFKRAISLSIFFFKSFHLINKIKPDIIHTHSADLKFLISFAAKKNSIPLIHTCHGISFPYKKEHSFFKRKLNLFALKNFSNKIIALNQVDNEFLKNKKINSSFIPNGVNKITSKNKIGKSNKIKFLFVGRLEKQKGLIYLIKAFQFMKTKPVELNIIGSGSQKNKLKKLVKELKIKNINFLGKQSYQKTNYFYNTNDVFILPSIWEGMPITILEAWSHGLPVITTNICGMKSFCNKQNSIIIEPKNISALTQAINKITTNKKLRNELKKEGLKTIQNYSWKNTCEQYIQKYNEII